MDCHIISLPELDKMPLRMAGEYLDSHLEHEVIGCACWSDKFPYKPYATFVIAVSATRLYVYFSVISKDLRAVHTTDLSPVADDSCVEFFMQVPGNDEYWNFEFNCIGTLNASHRINRPSPTRLNADQLASIKRYASCGVDPIENQEGTFCWDLTVSIPLSLLGLDADNLPDFIRGNFYKCGAKTLHPHYVAWNTVDTPNPDFHRPECFGTLWFRNPEPAVVEQPALTGRKGKESTGMKKLLSKLFGRN